MMQRIGGQMKKYATDVTNDAGGKSRIQNFAAWDDVAARDAVLGAVSRETRRIVQEEDLGDTAGWMHQGLGKLLFQFRRFGLVSYTRQILHGVAMRDAEVATSAMLSGAAAAAAYTAQYNLKAAAIGDEQKRKAFIAEHLTPSAIALAGYSRSNYASLMPAAIDTIASTAFDTRLFDNRSSGLGSDFVSGNPTVSALMNVNRAAGGVLHSIFRGDRRFTQGDATAAEALVPLRNLPGMDMLWSSVNAGLPKHNDDPDPKHVKWFFE